MKYLRFLIGSLAFAFGFGGCFCPVCENIFLDYEATALITEVTDGDTYKTQRRGETIIIRLLGADAYETRRGKRLRKQAESAGISADSAYRLGEMAERLAIDKLLNKTATLKRDTTQANIDAYGRLLRRVEINDSLFAEMLRARGLAAERE